MEDLLTHAANPNMATPRCTTPLHMALILLVGNPMQPPPVGQREKLLRVVGELVAVGSHTGLRTLTSPIVTPRGVSAREIIEKADIGDASLKGRLEEMVGAWPPAPPMPCTELARKVVYSSFRPREAGAAGDVEGAVDPAGSTCGPF